ncbi:MAG: hypothetical protein HY686_01680 [Chloroflexi bacterium]|nr:hypothetical protein [Chloroflexota bacterium]
MFRLAGLKERATLAGILTLVIVVSLLASTWSQVWAAPLAQQPEEKAVAVSGGIADFAAKNVTVRVPDGALTASVSLRYTALTAAQAAALAAPPAGRALGSQTFTLEVVQGTTVQTDFKFKALAELRVKYTQADLDAALGKKADSIFLSIYDTSSKRWVDVSATRDVVDMALSSFQTTLSTFAITVAQPLATPTPVTPPTPTPTPRPAAPTPTPTPRPPVTGDYAPGSGLILGLIGVGMLLVVGGGFYLLRSGRRTKA